MLAFEVFFPEFSDLILVITPLPSPFSIHWHCVAGLTHGNFIVYLVMLIFPIVSVTFIEIQNGTVINVDDQNTNVDFITGSSFKFESISNLLSSDIGIKYQLDFVPNSSVIFMIGENSDKEEVRGRFVLRYRNSWDGENCMAVEEINEQLVISSSNFVYFG